MSDPLRKIISRQFIAYSGTQITLECGHSIMSYSGRQSQQRIRCHKCGETK